MIEVEKKAYIKNPIIVENIKKIAILEKEEKKEDRYFTKINSSKIDIYSDPIFRTRKSGETQILSYKKKTFVNKTEVNEEHEFDVSTFNLSEFRSFCQYIGFFPFVEKVKHTRLYRLKKGSPFEVAIEHNTIEGLGDFVEVEILLENKNQVEEAGKAIDQILTEIGVSENDVEPRYYIDLLMEKS